MRSRAVRLLTLLSLLVAPLVVAASTQPAQADPEDFIQRRCGIYAAPCLMSATRNGSDVPADSTQFQVRSTGKLTNPDFKYFMFDVQPLAGSLSTSDEWVFEFNTGTLDPNYMEGFAGDPDMVRIDDGGTFRVRYTARPILYTYGCNTASSSWPWPCTEEATSEEIRLSVEVQDRSDDFARFFSAQSPQGVNGIFLETATDGSRYLLSEMVNSRFRPGGSLFQGQVRFRIPYAMLHDSFGVPDPSTMDASSLTGTVNGSTTAATFTVSHDADRGGLGGGLFVDVTNLTFPAPPSARAQAVTVPKKVIKVKRGVIVPKRPTNLNATRIDAHTGKVAFTKAVARGALPTGYKIRCVSNGGHVVTNTKTTATSPIRIGGLRTGVGYDCRVRATSKAGLGTWSVVERMPARP